MIKYICLPNVVFTMGGDPVSLHCLHVVRLKISHYFLPRAALKLLKTKIKQPLPHFNSVNTETAPLIIMLSAIFAKCTF